MSAALASISSWAFVAVRSRFNWTMVRTALSLVILQALLLPAARAESYDVTPGVPVRIWGSAYGYAIAPTPGAQVEVTGNDFLPDDNGVTTLALNGATSNTTAAVWFDTAPGTVNMEPGKVYTITVNGAFSGGSVASVALNGATPLGYELEINYLQRQRCPINSASHIYTVRVLGRQEQSFMAAGDATQLMLGRIYWQLGLGGLRNGGAAGSIALIDTGTLADWSALFTPSALQYEAAADEIVVIRTGGNVLRQVVANQAVVDIVPVSSTAYDIGFYHPAQASGTGTAVRTFTGQPYLNYRVEQGDTSTTLKITSTTRNTTAANSWTAAIARTAVTSLARVDDGAAGPPTFTWTRNDWNTSGAAQVAQQVTVSAGTVDDRTDTMVVRPGGSSTAVISLARNYHQYSWGEEITSSTSGSTDPLQSSVAYYDNTAEVGRHGFKKSSLLPGGGWEAYDYWDAASAVGTKRIGTLRYSYRPFNNAPASLNFNTSLGQVTTYDYGDDPFGVSTRPVQVITRVNNIITSKWTTAYSDIGTINGSMVTQAVRNDYVSALGGAQGYLTTTTRFYREDVADWFLRNRVHSVLTADSIKTSYAYQRGDFSGTTFTPNTAGQASRIATIKGIYGTSYTAYASYDIDDLALVSGKSTLETTIRDARALVARTESYVWSSSAWQLVSWVNFTYDTMGHLVSRVANNGATFTCEYNGDLKTYEIDESGIRTDYEYTADGRLWKAKKRNLDNTGFTTTRTFTYDAAGNVLAETMGGAGTTETIVTSRSYDDAGRIRGETPAGMTPASGQDYAINHTYKVAARSHTITNADGATRVETAQLDGRVEKIEGTAVVPSYYTYLVESDGRRATQVNHGTANSLRYAKNWSDWFGRPIKSETPGFSKSGQAASITQHFYVTATSGKGRLQSTTRTGYATTRYGYDAFGTVVRTGLDIDGSGAFEYTTASVDRITDSDQYVESYSGAYWLRSDSRTYFPGEATARTTAITRKRLTGHPAGRLEEIRSWDVEDIGATDATTVNTVDVNRAAKTVTTTTTAAGLANGGIAVAVNGLSQSFTSSDQLVSTSEYDPLERLWKVLAPRQGASGGSGSKTIYAYKTGTTMVQSVTDPAGNIVTTTEYDNLGRAAWTRNADSKYVRSAYNLRGQLYRQWGSATSPVEYGYDSTFGDRTTLSTFRSAPSGDSVAWPAVGDPDTTTWSNDPATTLLWQKIDATGKTVEFDYNVRGQVSSRKWARYLTATGYTSERVTATYDYYAATGEPWKVTYNDQVETIPTPDLTYTYDRIGRVTQVDESAAEFGMGVRTFSYDPAKPWRLLNETLPSALGSRVITRLYEEATSANTGTLGSFTKATKKGRTAGFELGIVGDTDRDLRHGWVFSNQPRFAAVSAATNGGAAVDFVYTYKTGSSLLDGYTRGSFTVSRDYETNRDLATRLESKWGTTSLARLDFSHDGLGRRVTAKQSGSAYAAYTAGQTYSAVYNVYAYNARDELESAALYRGDTPSTAPAVADELPERRFEYRYDSIGNRKSAGTTGSSNGAVDDAGTGDDDYAVNALNQYTGRENNRVALTGTVAANANVAVDGTMATPRKNNVWSNPFTPSNTTGPVIGRATVYAAIPGGGANGNHLVRTELRPWLVPKRAQAFTYDLDGNLTSDGLWEYTYNAENRLVRMTSLLPEGFGATLSYVRQRIDFKYDYTGRRIEKRVNDMDALTEISSRRFVYDGWNLVAELDGGGVAIQRSYIWGMDLTGDLTKAGGVGALLQMTNYTSGTPGASYYPAYDGNGNVVSLVNASTGALAAIYEYDPFGNLVRNEAIDSAVADNPFRFSTKYTDGETGLAYYGYRYYSPGLGRFINKDPIEETGGLNLYGFCGNNGINRWDYLGQMPIALSMAMFELEGEAEEERYANIAAGYRREEWYAYLKGQASLFEDGAFDRMWLSYTGHDISRKKPGVRVTPPGSTNTEHESVPNVGNGEVVVESPEGTVVLKPINFIEEEVLTPVAPMPTATRSNSPDIPASVFGTTYDTQLRYANQVSDWEAIHAGARQAFDNDVFHRPLTTLATAGAQVTTGVATIYLGGPVAWRGVVGAVQITRAGIPIIAADVAEMTALGKIALIEAQAAAIGYAPFLLPGAVKVINNQVANPAGSRPSLPSEVWRQFNELFK